MLNVYEYNDFTAEEKIMIYNSMRKSEIEKLLNSGTYNPKQIKIEEIIINSYYDSLIKQVLKEEKKMNNEERLSKVA